MDERMSSIMVSVRKLFLKYGLRSVTMDDIARELGVSKKTLYVHFKDKTDLVVNVVNQFIGSIKENISHVVTKDLNAIEQSFDISRQVGEEISIIQPTVFFDLKKYYPEAWILYEEFKNQFLTDIIRNNLKKGLEEGLYREDMDINIIAISYTNIINMVFDSEIYPFRDYNFRDVYLEIFSYHIHGIASQKGLEYLQKALPPNT